MRSSLDSLAGVAAMLSIDDAGPGPAAERRVSIAAPRPSPHMARQQQQSSPLSLHGGSDAFCMVSAEQSTPTMVGGGMCVRSESGVLYLSGLGFHPEGGEVW